MMLIQGGRVIDPKTGTDAVMDVAVENGKDGKRSDRSLSKL